MKFFKQCFLRIFFIIIIWTLIFSFIAGTFNFMDWSLVLRFYSVIVLFYAILVTEFE